ncbi:Phenoloxidase subunit 2 [Papilio machaon]|uniref:tyrosinase n=1 Tax=Papilio machaon TaxID=76193 RepID=A0A0N0PCZ0_PAPMA|nr:Phenoloxidase subunit 2 [Papilio machaon]
MQLLGLDRKHDQRIPIIIPRDYTATDLDVEHRLAYFREDLGVNLHHWHWHLVYPFTASDRKIVAKDRRGELFFYMHQQIIARYNGERLNNSLPRTKKFSNWREPIPEGYFPKLDSLTSSRGWPPRQAGMRWQDLNRPVDGLNVKVSDMERWRRNIEEAIATGMVRLENFGVLADEATTMRDPFFYRWHAFIDDLFQRYKETTNVRRYTRSELDNPGVQVTSAMIESAGGQANTLNTYWMSSDVDLSRGLDFSDRGPVFARFTHLNHRPFRYVINVNNTGNARRATCRIFIAPKFDERNLAWVLSDQRKMFIEMDRFVVPLNAGQNTITRNSSESSVTIPFEQTFRDLRAEGGNPRAGNLTSFNYCGCGWPQHMLVPRGTEAGASYQLFVMLSNYELDKIEQPDGTEMTCKQASSFCGLRDKKYPDKRAMGFPFDRPSATATNIEDFILPNMALVDLTIRLQNVTEPNPRNPQN